MSEQQTLTFPAARRVNPRKPSCIRVLVALQGIGGKGDAWACMTRLGPYSQHNEVAKRLGELAQFGYVVAVGSRMGPRSRPCTVFALTDVGQQHATEATT